MSVQKVLLLVAIGCAIGLGAALLAREAKSEDLDPRTPTYTTGVTVGPFHGGNSWPYTGTGVGVLLPTGQDPTIDGSYAGQMLDWKGLQQQRLQQAISDLLRQLHFAFDSAELTPKMDPVLDQLAQVLQENPEVWLLLGGHTDLAGSAKYNSALALRRAVAVGQALLDRGVEASRFEMVSFGETQPVEPVPGPSPTNRRVEVTPFLDQR